MMPMASDQVVRARISADLKQEATEVLDKMGLSVADAIRMMLVRVAAERALPFDVKVPNQTTQAAMDEARARKGKRFERVDDLMAHLNSDDD
jgi:DNA-damage-inducible protein J